MSWTHVEPQVINTSHISHSLFCVLFPQGHQKIAVAASALAVELETSLVPLVAQLDQTLLLVTLVK